VVQVRLAVERMGADVSRGMGEGVTKEDTNLDKTEETMTDVGAKWKRD